MRVIPSTLLALLTAVAATAPALAQVKPTEPFGGRPFGAPPGTPAPDTPATAETSTMGAPGTSSVTAPGTSNAGTPPTVVVAPVAIPAPPPPPPPPPPVPTAAIAPQAPPPATAMQSPTPAIAPTPQIGGNAPAPAAATIAAPFGGPNRNAPPAVAASTAQQPPVRGLPADAPKLVISGAVYSPDRKQRMLIVNGQTVREGADLGQGVVLQEVRQEGAVLGFKGTNYNVVF